MASKEVKKNQEICESGTVVPSLISPNETS